MAAPAEQLTEQEAAMYDRQLRVWGVETQRKLSGSKVLIAGCTGLAAEVAKNIVLAGVGSVTLVDDTPCPKRPPSNFLIAADAPAESTVAEACVATLQEMNPFVKVAALPGSPAAALAADTLRQYNLLLLCGQPAGLIAKADELCREAGVAFYAGVCRGIFGWAFADLGEHRYVVEKQHAQEDGGSGGKSIEERTEQFASWQQATSCSLQGSSLRRLNKLYLLLRACSRLEQQQQQPATAADLPALQQLRQEVCQEAGVDPAAAVPDEMLAAYASEAADMPAINAVVGGVLSNEVIKAVSGKGEPSISNFFLFSLAEGGTGSVEKMC